MPTRRTRAIGVPEDFLHGILRSRAGEPYHAKRESFERVLQEGGSTLADLVAETFGESRFAGTELPKAVVVGELLHDRLSLASWRFIRERLRAQPHLTDRRHTEEYAFDVALGWLTEEFIVSQLRSRMPAGTRVTLEGVDRERDFLPKGIRASPDVAVASADRRLSLELFVDHRGAWRRNKGMDLKKGKVAHLRSGETDFIFGFDLEAGRFHLVPPEAVADVTMQQNTAMGGVETCRIPIGEGMPIAEAARRIAEEIGGATGGGD